MFGTRISTVGKITRASVERIVYDAATSSWLGTEAREPLNPPEKGKKGQVGKF